MTSSVVLPTVKDLIADGVLTAPVHTHGLFRGLIIRAYINTNGEFEIEGHTYSSPSVAAGKTITAITKIVTSTRPYYAINGWNFWQIETSPDNFATLSDLRKVYLSKRHCDL